MILSIFSGGASAGDGSNAMPVYSLLAAPCDLTDCAGQRQRCQGPCASVFDPAAIAALNLPLRGDGNAVTGIAGVKPLNKT